jgi:hypothetical protein
VAIRWRFCDHLCANIATGTGLVLDHERLAKALCELLPNAARHNVRRSTRRIGHNDMNRTPGIDLRETQGWQGL